MEKSTPGSRRRRYEDSFKQEAVRLVTEEKRSPSEVERNLAFRAVCFSGIYLSSANGKCGLIPLRVCRSVITGKLTLH
jgi:hypothetical protein